MFASKTQIEALAARIKALEEQIEKLESAAHLELKNGKSRFSYGMGPIDETEPVPASEVVRMLLDNLGLKWEPKKTETSGPSLIKREFTSVWVPPAPKKRGARR